MNPEGAAALSKLRFFLYLIFLFDVLILFRAPIEGLFHYEGNRILYGLILMISAQTIVASMHIVKFASTLPPEQSATRKKSKKDAEKENRRRKNALRLSARIRYFVLGQFLFLLVLVLNSAQIKSDLVSIANIRIRNCNCF